MLIDSVLNTDVEEATSQMETNETSLTNTEIMNKTGEQDCISTEISKEESARELSVVLESNHRKKRYSRLKHAIDSDSDDEHERSTPDEESASLPVGKTHRKIALIHSDSEPDNDEESSKPDDETVRKPKRLAVAIFDSDLEVEESKSRKPDRSDEENENAVRTADANETDAYAFDKKGKLVSENNDYNKLYSRMSALWDPDTSSEEDENEGASATNEPKSELPGVTRNVKQNKKSKPKQQRAAESPKKMTGKEAMEQKREILSHSSRRARERQVSLPYHKPKHRSLQEFLQNRPRFADALPKHAAQARPSLAIKMSAEQLEAMSKNLQEREKKLEEFFKSESESEEEQSTNEVNSEDATVADQTMNCDESEQINDGGVNSGETLIQLNENTEKEEEEVGGESAANSEESIVKEMDAVTNSEENCLNKKEEAATNVSPSSEIPDGENCNVHENLSPQELEQKKLDDLIAKYSDVEATKCDEPSKTEQAEHKMKSKLELLSGDTLALREPRLRGNPNEVIDLDEGVTRPSEVTQLVERFMQHTFKKNHHKTKVHVDVISMVDGEIRKEILSVPIDPDEMESVAVIEKPGARLKKLQDELQTQMAQRRSELWKQKSHLQQGQNKNTEGCDDAMLDDDDNEEECEYTESEPEASDEELAQEKPRKKLAFADEEAEESDDELLNVRDEEKEEDAGNDDDDDDDEIEEDPPEVVDDGDDESEDNTQSEVKRKRKLKRIVQAFTDDSDDDDEAGEEEKPKPPPSLVAMQKSKADDSTDTWDDSGPPPNQPRSNQTPRRREFSQTKSQLGFLTPVFRLTGLQNFNSGTKFLRESPVTPFNLDVPPSPTPPTSQALLQQKLFDEAPPNEEDAKSQSTVVPPSPSKTPAEITNDTVPSTQDLLEICSGSFSPTKEGSIKPPENNTSVSGGEVSEAHPVPVPSLLNSNEIEESLQCKASADGDNDDRIISQLLDEEELENFKKKFESPLLKPNSQAATSVSPTKVGRFIFDSSDEETNEEKIVQKAAKQKKLVFSDEDEEEEAEDQNYNILSEHSDSEEEEEVDENDEKIVEYDSEENEIEGGLKPKPTFKVADFVENEAELSESDWGSADEDEKDLDELEFEQGDAETFDENKVRSDLERIHMRRILDDDNREVRLLQELLLEDGELHGTGRQRQFKWKNIDSANNEVEDVKEDACVDEYAEGENEEQWRKLRYQRELFLKKMQNNTQENSDDDTCLAYESQVFKLGQAALRRSNSQNTATDSERHFESANIKQHRLLQVKRGSFLSRNDEVLTRLAEYSKVTTTNASSGAPVKNSRQFVFKSVEEVTVGGRKRRKPSDGTPTAIKKLRLSELSPAAASARSENSSSRVKKLFGNW